MEIDQQELVIQKYSNYKDSGAEWLGEIPAHWHLLSNKYIFRINKNQVGANSANYVLLSLTLNGVIKRDMENPQGKFPAEFNTYQEVRKGDFIFCLFDVEETPRTVGLSDFDGMITGAYTVMACDQRFDKGYLYYFYLNLDNDKRLRPLYTGLRNIISKESFLSFKTFVPPLAEQAAIANFLDRKTALIDKAIAIKQKQIELLKERKEILIQRAVTKGLNPNVKMKDSGVEWIGEVPEHWEVKRLKNVCVINRNSLPEDTNRNLGFEYVDIGSVTLEGGIVKTEYFVFKEAPSRARRIARDGDTIVSTVRTYLKAIDFIEGSKCNFIYSTGFAILQPEDFISPKFLACFARSDAFTQQVTVHSKGMSYPAINSTDLGGLTVVYCGIAEQEEIVNHIETTSRKVGMACGLLESEIAKLNEYKASLTNSAVTGKIKVC